MATILCYIDAVFGLIFGFVATSVLAGLITVARSRPAASASPTRRSGATRSPSAARCSRSSCCFAVFGTDGVHVARLIISLLFDGALVALLLHPMSREYQRIWFK